MGGEEHEVRLKERDRCGYLQFGANPVAAPIIRELGFPPYDVRFTINLAGTEHVATVGWPPNPDSPEHADSATFPDFEPALPGREYQ